MLGTLSQSQGLVLSLLNYFQQEKDDGGPLLPLLAVQEGGSGTKYQFVHYYQNTAPFII
ncbi:unnamed protein product [Acanthoscelides obtectus]|uniref:Uncharacterized protein n=1 Tax=Acanthoscelides obtectus TaxID=200917 RepID=A0A9P0P2B4_ACAOB|nr:unnamed protein product [Acanthoscelides obtectus]CAK1663395.1 hypothetical protein AOBTE_LOCUS23647 [Acanthoscelides obtectus]